MVGILGEGGKTRLTWLLNMDFGGLIPSAFIQRVFEGMMAYPISTLEETKTYHNIVNQSQHSETRAKDAEAQTDLEDILSEHLGEEVVAKIKGNVDLFDILCRHARDEREFRLSIGKSE